MGSRDKSKESHTDKKGAQHTLKEKRKMKQEKRDSKTD